MNRWKDRAVSVVSDAAKPLLLAGSAIAVTAAFRGGLLEALDNNPTFSFTFAGSFEMYLATRPRLPAVAGTVLLGLLLRVVFGAAVGFRPYFGSWLIGSAGFAGMAGLVVLAAAAVRTRNLAPFAKAAFFPSAAIVLGFFVPAMSLSPLTCDARLLAVDAAIGFQLSFLLGQMTGGSVLLWQLTTTVYYALPLAVAVSCVAGRPLPKDFRRLLMFGCLAAAGGFVCFVCPATGPIYAFRDQFPYNPPRASEIPVRLLAVPTAPRNAMPSIHVAAALLIFWNSLSLRKTARIIAGLFLVATAFSTLALGEHYLVDLVVAVPFALIFHAAFSGASRTTAVWCHRAILGGALLSAGWLVVLRFWVQLLLGWPGVMAFLSLSTVGVSIFMQTQLSGSSTKQPSPLV
jgi:hypothetical protein